MPWMKHQPWNEGKTDADMAPEVEWNLWQRRQQPFADLEEGSRLFLVVPDGADSIIRLESEVAHVLKYRYTSKDDAWKALRADFPILDDFPFTKKQFLNGYAGDAPDQGWLLAWSQVLIRKIGVVRPRELKFRPNGWLHIDDDQVRQYGLNRGRRLEPPPDPTRPPRAIDPLKRKAVENRAMDVAHDELVRLGCDPVTIANTSAKKPYDYTCTRAGKQIRVEVKGLSGPLSAVTLTRNEVDNARYSGHDMILVVVHGITLTPTAKGGWKGSGGTPIVWDPWDVDAGHLTASAFDYALPGSPAGSDLRRSG